MKPERMRAKCHLVRPAVGAPSHRVSYLQQRQPGRGEEVPLKFLSSEHVNQIQPRKQAIRRAREEG